MTDRVPRRFPLAADLLMQPTPLEGLGTTGATVAPDHLDLGAAGAGEEALKP
jgi:hypothetical protein